MTVGLEKTHYLVSEEDISEPPHLEICVVMTNADAVEYDVAVNLSVSNDSAGMCVHTKFLVTQKTRVASWHSVRYQHTADHC